MRNLTKTFTALAIVSMVVGSATTPVMAKVYTVVFAGKPTQVDCPESPEGHNLTWVNQNCTAVRIAPGGRMPVGRSMTMGMPLGF